MRVDLGTIKGADGAQGPQGIQGIQGIQGVQGVQGNTPTITIGTVTTGEEGTAASATITGTPPNYVLNLVIPRGESGGGDMKANIYDPEGHAEDLFAYIDAKGVTFDGGTFTGAVLLRSGAPESDAEAAPKGYVDSAKTTLYSKINDFIDALNDSECGIKRNAAGSIYMEETADCHIASVTIADEQVVDLSDSTFVQFFSNWFEIVRSNGNKGHYAQVTDYTGSVILTNPDNPTQTVAVGGSCTFYTKHGASSMYNGHSGVLQLDTSSQVMIGWADHLDRSYDGWKVTAVINNLQIAFEKKEFFEHIAED